MRGPLVQRLIDLQQERDLTGSDMARLLGVVPSTWTRLVAGSMQPSVKIYSGVIRAFPELEPFCVQLLRIGSDVATDPSETVEVA